MRAARSWWLGLNRWIRRGIVAGACTLALLVVLVAGIGYFFSSDLLGRSVAPPDLSNEVLKARPASAAAPRTVRLEPSEETERNGVFGLDTGVGHAILGRIVKTSDVGVTRRVRDVQGELDRGTETDVDTIVYNGNPEQSLGDPFQAITYRGPLGPMDAWYTPGRGKTWAVMVHGYKASRRGGMRDYGVLRGLGMPILNITYRNDPGQPAASDGLLHLGQEEWRDLQASMQWALDHGAKRFVLFGDSMGGAIVCTLYHRSDLADRVRALVLDAPVLNWKDTLHLQADNRGLPGIAVTATELWVRARIGFDFGDFDQLAKADSFKLPILLFHGTDDDVVPFGDSKRFSEELPTRVTFYPVKGAGHVQSWNVDPRRYERRLNRFLVDRAGIGDAPGP